MKLITKTFLLFFISFFVFTSCSKSVVKSESSPTKAMAKNFSSINNTKWTFMNYSINKLPTSFEKMANIQFNNLITNSVQYSGKSFVNYYGGTLKIDEIKGLIIQENNGFSTKMASDESSMKAEYDYFANLAKTTYFEFSGDRLLLYLGDKTNSKTEIMTFIRDI